MQPSAQRDWKVSAGYRTLTRIGGVLVVVGVWCAGAATALGSVGVWWIVAGLGASGLLVAATLPEPVPRDYISGAPTRVNTRPTLQTTEADQYPFAA